jgi:branched-chain amino acid transport system ATP-binding protein
LEGVSRSFGGLMAVRSVDLVVNRGEILGLIGPNGAGKTTLFNLITGLYRPTSGKVFLDQLDITSRPPPQRCKLGIARTFQLVRPFQNLTALQNVAIGRIYGREPARSRKQADVEAKQLLDLVGLVDRQDAMAHQLTLVERKRLELARALATRPWLLLLDELLAGLNPSEVNASLDLIGRIRAGGTTIVMVEHLVKAVFGISDRVAVLNAGEKIAEGAPVGVASDQKVIDAYLGPPDDA